MNYKHITAITVATLLATVANAEWHYGVGTGIGASSYDGDAKFGAVEYDVDFDSGDFEGGLGGSAFATNGTWVFTIAGSTVEYENKDTPKGGGARTKNKFEQSGGEFTVGYVVFNEDAIKITPFAGIRATKHEWTRKDASKFKDDASWTDSVFGVKVDYQINEEWTWNNMAQYSAGDSEGCSAFSTGVSWRFSDHWVTGVSIKYSSDEFEESNFDGVKYKYDTDVTTLGLSIAYLW